MWEYSEKVLEHYRHPRNVGKIDNADLIGEAGSLACGDSLKLYIKLDGSVIKDAKFQTFGCGSAVASSSILTEMIIGKTLEEAKKITNKDIADELGGLPQEKMHCSVMGQEALEDALKKYYGKEEIEKEAGLSQNGDKIVCTCFNVTENQIWEAIKVNGLKTVEEVTNYTKAGGACGRCKGVINDIIETYLRKEGQAPVMTAAQKILKIGRVIDQQISPQLQKDGGDIDLIDVEGNKVKVKLTGMCSGCKNATMTLKAFVESVLRDKVDSSLEVEQV
ncbi:TPA: Fe-S cluster assembly protein NifU [Candidatus Gastranaerophilales bacterium HUM_19]|nr:MAG TPA: Fe-S cluster assembly protein NifU [Candidatus Gastranaerophilales bacterium HUM_17]DAB19040.1 MAG TPA: Fe-S cluster assembly protein NifU [Candidatus Gastranaerophilales bacterium HUM_19]DAB26181.1 MAG TPA: Fe-S cluster assembly protein NifU [Candidatus Gastranaerophilales bacterium HUM_23]